MAPGLINPNTLARPNKQAATHAGWLRLAPCQAGSAEGGGRGKIAHREMFAISFASTDFAANSSSRVARERSPFFKIAAPTFPSSRALTFCWAANSTRW